MKIKLIELLNKIANGEDVPKKIKWEGIIYAYSEYDKDYLEYPFSDEEYKGLFNMRDSILTQFLNDEVEIIEDKKIEKLAKNITDNACATIDQRTMANKINEIIDAVNELKGGNDE